MAGLLEFAARFWTEERCIEHLAGLRWPGGFVCAGCGGRQAWRLKARPRVYECTACHRQESVTAATVLHRTRTDDQGAGARHRAETSDLVGGRPITADDIVLKEEYAYPVYGVP